MIAFIVYANEDGSEVSVVQVHPDAESMMLHMAGRAAVRIGSSRRANEVTARSSFELIYALKSATRRAAYQSSHRSLSSLAMNSRSSPTSA